MWKLYGGKYPIGDPIDGHELHIETNEHTAITEGWAEFLPHIIQKNDLVYDRINYETTNYYTTNYLGQWNGNRVEGLVFSILYDISDDETFTDLFENVDDDGIPGEFVKVWNIMRDSNPDALDDYDESDNDFWDAWFNAGYGYREEMNAIYYEHGINKNTKAECWITYPNQNQWYSGDIKINAISYDWDGVIIKLNFYYSTNGENWEYLDTVNIDEDDIHSYVNGSCIFKEDKILADSSVCFGVTAVDGYKWIDGYDEIFKVMDDVEEGPRAEVCIRIDNVQPGKPRISSPSHKENKWSENDDVTFTWTTVSDAHSGLDGYAYAWAHNPDTEPLYKYKEEDETSLTIYNVADRDDWYFHLRAVDNAGNMGETDHYGPIKIRTYHDVYPYVYNDAPAQKVELYIDDNYNDKYTKDAPGYGNCYFDPINLQEGKHDFTVVGKNYGSCNVYDVNCIYDDQSVYVGKLKIPSYLVYPYAYNDGPSQFVYLEVDGIPKGSKHADAYSNVGFPPVNLQEGNHDFKIYGADYGSCSLKNYYVEEDDDHLEIGDLIYVPSTTITITPSSQDAYVSIFNPDSNYGSESVMWVIDTHDDGAREFSYIEFDILSIPSGKTIESATLKLRCVGLGTPARVYVYEVMDSWDEDTVTWNSGEEWYTSPESSTYVDSFGWHSWDVTQHVNDWYTGARSNYDFVLVRHKYSPHSSYFATKEHSSYKPKLEVTYGN